MTNRSASSLLHDMVSRVAVLAPVIAIGALLVGHSLFSPSPWVIAAQVFAVGIGIWARRSFSKGQFRTGADPAPGGLIRSGPYRIVRHPMYTAALVLVWSGVLSHWSTVNSLIGLSMVAVLVLRIPIEERAVREQYAEYEAYARTTKRLVPFVY